MKKQLILLLAFFSNIYSDDFANNFCEKYGNSSQTTNVAPCPTAEELSPFAKDLLLKYCQGISTLISFSAAAREFPNSITFDNDGNAYVTIVPLGQVYKITPEGVASVFATLPSVAFPASVFGIAFGPGNGIYVAVRAGTANLSGIWRVNAAGDVTLYANLPTNAVPNGLAFDNSGNLYVSDSTLGIIYKVNSLGVVSTWKNDPLFLGTAPTNIGVNGLAFDATYSNLYASNTDKGTILRIPVNANGTAGTVVVAVNNPTLLNGADGMAFDPAGNLFVAVTRKNTIVKVAPDLTASIFVQGNGLDFPSDVKFGKFGNRCTLYVVNWAAPTQSGRIPMTPNPAIIVINPLVLSVEQETINVA